MNTIKTKTKTKTKIRSKSKSKIMTKCEFVGPKRRRA
jgi:hypothetical protein